MTVSPEQLAAAPSARPTGSHDRAAGWLVVALLCLGIGLVYGQVRAHDFVDYDDHFYVRDNPHLREPLDARWLAHELTHVHHAYWIPLTWISYRVDAALWGHRAPSFLLTNVALHALGSVLLFVVLRRLTGALWPSALAAALFALHPLRVESVAWVTERKDVLAGVFWMLALLVYARHAERPGWRTELALVATLALGLMAKPSLMTLPLALVLLDFWPLGRLDLSAPRRLLSSLSRSLLEKASLFGLSVAAGLLVLHTQRRQGGMGFADTLPMGRRLANAVESCVAYLGDFVWPAGLSPFYPHPAEAPPWWRPAAAALLLAAITGAALWQAKRRPWLLFGWSWFLITLLPVLGLVGVGMQARADRFTYLPSIGLAVAVAFAAAAIARGIAGARLARTVAVAAALAALIALGLRAHEQVAKWRDTTTLFEHAVALDPQNWYAHHRLAVAHRQAGRLERAARHYVAALAAQPDFAYAQGELGDVLAALGQPERAAPLYDNVARTTFGDPAAAANLGLVFVSIGERDAAATLLERALRRAPDAVELRVALAAVRRENGS